MPLSGLTPFLQTLREAGLWRDLRPPEGVCFSHNDYLGLSQHPHLKEAGERFFRDGRAGSRGSRLLGGNSYDALETEQAIADFFGAPAAVFFSSGYLANLGVVGALARVARAFASDAHNHASLIDAIRLSKKPCTIVPHQGWADWTADADDWVLVAESLYSMSGCIVAEESLRGALRRSQGFLFLDEAHAGGILGPGGRGVSAPWREWDAMAVGITFGKAFGAAGGAVLCSTQVRDLLVNAARPFIYSTAPAPVVLALVRASLEVMQNEGEALRERLRARIGHVVGVLREAGIALEGDAERGSPILSLPLPGNDRALRFARTMRNSGWDLRAIRYPTVAAGSERIRLSVTLAVTQQQTEQMAQEVVKQWKAFS